MTEARIGDNQSEADRLSQYVIEFGAERPQPIATAIGLCLPSPHDISVDAPGKEMHYLSTEKLLAEVVADLEVGSAASAVIRGADDRIRYALITNPRFNKSGLSKWMGTVEVGVDAWSFVWDVLLAQPELLFACVGREEGVEL